MSNSSNCAPPKYWRWPYLRVIFHLDELLDHFRPVRSPVLHYAPKYPVHVGRSPRSTSNIGHCTSPKLDLPVTTAFEKFDRDRRPVAVQLNAVVAGRPPDAQGRPPPPPPPALIVNYDLARAPVRTYRVLYNVLYTRESIQFE